MYLYGWDCFIHICLNHSLISESFLQLGCQLHANAIWIVNHDHVYNTCRAQCRNGILTLPTLLGTERSKIMQKYTILKNRIKMCQMLSLLLI